MRANRQVARDISYAGSAQSRSGRALIRVLENATGRLRLIRRAEGYEDEVAGGRDFWHVIVERYGLSLDIAAGSLLIREAGGIISGLDGSEKYLDNGHVLAGTPKIYADVAKLCAAEIKSLLA